MEMMSQTCVWVGLARLAIVILTVFLAWMTYQSNLLLKRIQPDFNLLLSLPEVIVRVILVGVCLWLAWLSGLPVEQLGLTIANPIRQVGIGLGVGLALQVSINLLTYQVVNYFGREIYSPVVILNILPRRPLDWVLVPLALVPAVAMEELLFRSLWLGGFGGIIPMPVLIAGISLVFGLMHLPQGQLGVIVSAALNVLLSVLFVWTGSILVPFVAHYVINTLQVIVAHFQREWLENY